MCHHSVAVFPYWAVQYRQNRFRPPGGTFPPLETPNYLLPSFFSTQRRNLSFLLFTTFSLCSSWLSSVLTRNSLTSAGIHPLPAPLVPLEMTCSTGKRLSWVLVTPHTLAVSSSLPFTSLPTTPSSLPRSTSPLASTTPTSTPTAASVWTS